MRAPPRRHDAAATPAFDRLPPAVARLLTRLRRRLRVLAAARGLGLTAAVGVPVAVLALLADRYFFLGTEARVALTGAGIAAFGLTALIFLVVPLARPLAPLRLARRIEAASPGFRGELLSVVDISRAASHTRDGMSAVLLGRLWATSDNEAARVDLRRLAPGRRARRAAIAGALALGLAALSALAEPDSARLLAARFFHPRSELPRPTRVALSIVPGSTVARRGSAVTVVATEERGTATSATLTFRSADGNWQKTAMQEAKTAAGGGSRTVFSASLPPLHLALVYRVDADDFQSPLYALEPREPPRPVEFAVLVTPPAYTGRAPLGWSSPAGDVAALRSSEVEVAVTVDIDIRAARCVLSNGEALPCRVEGRQVRLPRFTVEQDRAYSVVLEGVDGVSGTTPEYILRAIADRAPRVDILEPSGPEAAVEERTRLRLRARAEDDVGIEKVDVIRVAPPPEALISSWRPDPAGPAPLLAEPELAVDIAALDVKPGASVTIVARTRDALAQDSRSTPLVLRVPYLPESTAGAVWVRSLAFLDQELRGLERGWRTPANQRSPPSTDAEASLDSAVASSRAEAEDAVAWAALAVRLAEAAEEVSAAAAGPSPYQATLAGLGLALREAADAAPVAVPAAAPTSHSSRERAGSSRREIGALLRAAVIDAAALDLRLLRHECAALAAETPDSILPGTPASARLVAVAAQVFDAARGTAGVLAELSSSHSLDLDERVRAFRRTVVSPLEAASKAASLSDSTGMREPLRRTEEALVLRLAEMAEESHGHAARAAAARRALRLPPSPAARAAELARLLARAAMPEHATSEGALARREVLAAGRAFLRTADALEARSRSFESPDFESLSLLGMVRELAERSLEPGTAPAAAAETAKGMAAACLAIEPALVLGHAAQELDWLAQSTEDAAMRLRSLAEWQVHGLEIAREDAALALGAARDAVETLRERTARPEDEGLRRALAAVYDETARAATSQREVLAALDAVPRLPAAAATAAAAASVLFLQAASRLHEIRSTSLPQATAAAAWLQNDQGTISERLARLAAAVADHAATAGVAAGSDASAGGAAPRDLVDLHGEDSRRTRVLAGSLRAEAELSLARSGSTPGSQAAAQALHTAAARVAAVGASSLASAGIALSAAVAASATAEAREHLAEAARLGVESGEAIAAIARALSVLTSDGLASLGAAEMRSLLEESRREAASPPADLATIRTRAASLLAAAQRGREEIDTGLPSSPAKVEILAHLDSALTHLRGAILDADAGDLGRAEARLLKGTQELEAALAAASRLTQDAGRELRGDESNGETEAAGESNARTRELEAVEKELARLLALRGLEREAALLVAELARAADADPTRLSAAREREDQLAKLLGDVLPSSSALLELVARLLRVEEQGQRVGEVERRLEEEARNVLAAGATIAPPLIQEQVAARDDVGKAAAEFRDAGTRLTILLPRLFESYSRTGAAAEPLLLAVERGVGAMQSGDTRSAAEALSDVGQRLGAFLAGVSATRHLALEAIADLEGAAVAPGASVQLQRAIDAVRAAAQSLSQGRPAEALSRHERAAQSLRAASAALGERLRRLPLGPEGARLSRALEEELAGAGLSWEVDTRGESASEIDSGDGERPEDLPAPPAYRDVIQLYLRALRTGG